MKNSIQFANISITSQNLELLDYAEIFIQSVFHNQEPRKTSRASYYFLDVDIDYMEKENPLSLSIYGRFVKDTTLVREQVLKAGEIIKDRETLRTSPSFFFVFNLADHLPNIFTRNGLGTYSKDLRQHH